MTHTVLEITEDVTDVSITGDQLVVNITDDVTKIEAFTFAAHNTITANNVQTALEQLADQDFRGTSTPSGSNIQEGDTWYDTDDDQLKVYRETSTGVFAWVPIMIGNISADSDTVDAGSY